LGPKGLSKTKTTNGWGVGYQVGEENQQRRVVLYRNRGQGGKKVGKKRGGYPLMFDSGGFRMGGRSEKKENRDETFQENFFWAKMEGGRGQRGCGTAKMGRDKKLKLGGWIRSGAKVERLAKAVKRN